MESGTNENTASNPEQPLQLSTQEEVDEQPPSPARPSRPRSGPRKIPQPANHIMLLPRP
jgi:hypothetical protein